MGAIVYIACGIIECESNRNKSRNKYLLGVAGDAIDGVAGEGS